MIPNGMKLRTEFWEKLAIMIWVHEGPPRSMHCMVPLEEAKERSTRSNLDHIWWVRVGGAAKEKGLWKSSVCPWSSHRGKQVSSGEGDRPSPCTSYTWDTCHLLPCIRAKSISVIFSYKLTARTSAVYPRNVSAFLFSLRSMQTK